MGITNNNPVVMIEAERFTPDQDWNQLMEVVEKFTARRISVRIDSYAESQKCEVSIWDDPEDDYTVKTIDSEPIQAVYQAVTEYIKQQKK